MRSVMARLDCPLSFLGMLMHRCPLSVGLLPHLGAPLLLLSTMFEYLMQTARECWHWVITNIASNKYKPRTLALTLI